MSATDQPAGAVAEAAPVALPPPGEPERSLRISIVEGCFSTVHGALTGGALATAYALMLGARDIHLGLLTALTTVAMVGSLIGARAVAAAGARRGLATWPSVGGRLLWPLLCAIPFVPVSVDLRLGLFLAVVFLSNLGVQASTTAWTSWMTDLVPVERRGRYFGLRNMVCSAVGMAATFAVGHLFDLFRVRAEAAHAAPALAFVPFFGISALFAVAAGWMYLRQWEPPLHGERPLPLAAMLRLPFADRAFRRLMLFSVLWAQVCSIAGPFFAAHMLRNLHMSLSQIAVYSILVAIVSLAAQPAWGRIVDRAGNRPVLVFNMVGVFFLPLLWLPATADRLWPIWLDALLTGFFWPGINQAMFNLVIGTAPRANRTSYLAVQSLATGLSQFAAALAGGAIAQATTGLRATVGDVTLINYHALFTVSAFGRLALVPLALRLREDRADSVGALIGRAGDWAARLFGDSLEAGASAWRRWSRPGGGPPRTPPTRRE